MRSEHLQTIRFPSQQENCFYGWRPRQATQLRWLGNNLKEGGAKTTPKLVLLFVQQLQNIHKKYSAVIVLAGIRKQCFSIIGTRLCKDLLPAQEQSRLSHTGKLIDCHCRKNLKGEVSTKESNFNDDPQGSWHRRERKIAFRSAHFGAQPCPNQNQELSLQFFTFSWGHPKMEGWPSVVQLLKYMNSIWFLSKQS